MSYKQMTGNLISATKLVPTANSSSAYGVATGVWNLNDMYDYKRGGQWPIPAGVPGAPTISGVTGGDAQVAVAFSANADNGGLTVSSFTATASSGQTASGSSSPLTVTSLTNLNAITFTVTATNASGTSAASSASSSVTPTPPSRGIFAGGYNASVETVNTIDYVQIQTTGNASDFGDLSSAQLGNAAVGNISRVVICTSADSDKTLEYVNPFTTGNVTNFGDLARSSELASAINNSINGLFLSKSSATDFMKIVIATAGNSVDFGDIRTAANFTGGNINNTTIGLVYGGYAGAQVNTIDQKNLNTNANSTDFGDLTATTHRTPGGGCSTTRGVLGGGDRGGSLTNVIDYVTIASAGNATDFGNLTLARRTLSAASDKLRCVFSGGYGSGVTNRIDYITISSLGNATDFGDLTVARQSLTGVGTSHGGIA